jgi:succinate dehydrogenase/fumarate reductase flavoprotein subunit
LPPRAGAAGVHSPEDSLDEHAYDTISGGDWLCDQDAVEAFVKEAPLELMRLEHWGCPWSREPDGRVAVRPFGGMKKTRTWFAADKTGFHMLHTLFQTSLKYNSVVRYDEYYVTRLLVDDGRVQGVVALELTTGKIQAITAKAVILCTGGCGRIFRFTTNAAIKTGDGMALAYRAGAPLKDMEFIQYHPTGLPFTGILITEAARAEGGYLVNKDGYRYLQDYNLGTPEPKPVFRSMELGPRDRLSQAFVHEQAKGRTVEGTLRRRGESRPSPFGREDDQYEAPLCPRAVPQVREHRSHHAVDSGPSGGSLHDGWRLHGHQRGHAVEGLVRGGRGSLREHQWGQPAGFEFTTGAARVRRQSRARGGDLCG